MTVIFTVISTGAIIVQIVLCVRNLIKRRKKKAVGPKKYTPEVSTISGITQTDSKVTEE